MITPSEVIEHIYCPRFTYYMNVLNIPQFEDRRFKVLKGREVHKRRETENRFYLRKKIGVVDRDLNVYLASPSLSVRGVVDEVLTLEDGSLAPLDYKYSPYREYAFKTHRIQIILYGLLAREAYQKPVSRGYIAYIRGGSRLVEVPIGEAEEITAQQIVAEILDIIQTGRLPKKTPHRAKCSDCCYKNICV
ncbi:MAG: CRISPR-associated protein Cas4 [Gemmatimonadetes bacterium]|nr:CRISPR-associated protein Cas4 [Gemmatimonadota bacterium]